MSIKMSDNKYHFFEDKQKNLVCYRYETPWREFIGDKAVHRLYDLAIELQSDNEKLKEAILKYGNNPAGFDWAVLDEIDRLKAENERFRAGCFAYDVKGEDLDSCQIMAENIKLTAELEAAKKTQFDLEEEIAKVYEDNKKLRSDLEAAKVKAELAEARELLETWLDERKRGG
jgi:hypothetical protein